MNISAQLKPALWGIAGGALALATLGFGWGGWTTSAQADSIVRTQIDNAVVAALAPVCVDKFQRAGDAPANLAALRRIDNKSQGRFVEKGGWAAVPGNNSSERLSEVARACATLLLTSA